MHEDGAAFAVARPRTAEQWALYTENGYQKAFGARRLSRSIRRNLWAQAEFDAVTVRTLEQLRRQYAPDSVCLPSHALVEVMTDLYSRGLTLSLIHISLEQQGLPVRKISFPNYESPACAPVKMYLAGEFGQKPGDVNAYAASTFYAVDRYASFQKDWRSYYDDGGVVIADRYTTSNGIHQCSKLPREEWDAYLDWLRCV